MDETGAILARLDANVNNLMSQMTDMKAAQRDMVSRERLDIEVRTREADSTRLQGVLSEFAAESRAHRGKLEQRISQLEDANSRARGALWALSLLTVGVGSVLSYLVGHLYIR
jgi:BMFP domain-containing protein YqiC